MTPAERVLEKIPAPILARYLKLYRTTPYNWLRRGGVIPQKYHKSILALSKELNADLKAADLYIS